MSETQQADSSVTGERNEGGMSRRIGPRHPVGYRTGPLSASARIARAPGWEDCSEKFVRQMLPTHFRRCASALQVLAEMGLPHRVAELEAIVLDAGAPDQKLTLKDALHLAQLADTAEQVREDDVRHAIETETLTIELVEQLIRASAQESYRAQELRQAARAWVAARRAEG